MAEWWADNFNVAASFDTIADLSEFTVSRSADTLACLDLSTGRTQDSALQALRTKAHNMSLRSCSDLSKSLCFEMVERSIRALCPQTCLCDTPKIGNLYTTTKFGCPARCGASLTAKMALSTEFNNSVTCTDVTSLDDETRFLNAATWGRGGMSIYRRQLWHYLSSSSSWNQIAYGLGENFLVSLGIPANKTDDFRETLISGSFVLTLGKAEWMEGVPFSRGLAQPCEVLASGEMTLVLGINLCGTHLFRSLRFACPVSCGCKTRGGFECPAACLN